MNEGQRSDCIQRINIHEKAISLKKERVLKAEAGKLICELQNTEFRLSVG